MVAAHVACGLLGSGIIVALAVAMRNSGIFKCVPSTLPSSLESL